MPISQKSLHVMLHLFLVYISWGSTYIGYKFSLGVAGPFLVGGSRMVIGGIEAMPTSLLSPASTITTTLTTSMAVYAEGSAQDDVLWALGLLLMGMSLIFILIIHLIGRKGAKARG